MSGIISWADGQKILDMARQAVIGAKPSQVQKPPETPANPPGWSDKTQLPPSPGDVVTRPVPPQNNGDPGAEVPADFLPTPSTPGQWEPRGYAYGSMAKYGPHNPAITPEQAQTLHLLWSIQGIDGSTVGRGTSVPAPAHVESDSGSHDKRMN